MSICLGQRTDVDLLITYDVETTTNAGRTRLRRVAKICEAYGHRVQKSVFEVVCRDADKLRLVVALNSVIDHAHDSVRIYRLPARALDDIEYLGTPRQVEPRGPIVI
jgi:CRISPR-associated protein Cas2